MALPLTSRHFSTHEIRNTLDIQLRAASVLPSLIPRSQRRRQTRNKDLTHKKPPPHLPNHHLHFQTFDFPSASRSCHPYTTTQHTPAFLANPAAQICPRAIFNPRNFPLRATRSKRHSPRSLFFKLQNPRHIRHPCSSAHASGLSRGQSRISCLCAH